MTFELGDPNCGLTSTAEAAERSQHPCFGEWRETWYLELAETRPCILYNPWYLYTILSAPGLFRLYIYGLLAVLCLCTRARWSRLWSLSQAPGYHPTHQPNIRVHCVHLLRERCIL